MLHIRNLKRTHFYTIDNEVYQMKLGPYALLVYNALSFHANPNQEVFCSQSLLAEEVGISLTQCHRALIVLRARGLIAIERVSGKINRYTLLPIKKKNQEPLPDRQGDTPDRQGDTPDRQGVLPDRQGSSQEISRSPMSVAALRVASFLNKTSKQNNITKLDEQKGPPEADKSSFQEGEEQNPDGSRGLQSAGDGSGSTTPEVSSELAASPATRNKAAAFMPNSPVLTKEMTDLIEDIQKWSRQYCRVNGMNVSDNLTGFWAGCHIERLGVAKVRQIFEEEANAHSPCLDSFWKALKAANAASPAGGAATLSKAPAAPRRG